MTTNEIKCEMDKIDKEIKATKVSLKGKPDIIDQMEDRPEKSVGIYCKYCGRMKEGKTDFSYYDEHTGKPIYYEELNCPSWWCKICNYFDIRGPHIDG